jgi:hypothetical protein
MWNAGHEILADARSMRFVLELDGRPATVGSVLSGWKSDADFRSLFNSLLADAHFSAFRWETPPVTADNVGRPFGFVLSTGLVWTCPV